MTLYMIWRLSLCSSIESPQSTSFKRYESTHNLSNTSSNTRLALKLSNRQSKKPLFETSSKSSEPELGAEVAECNNGTTCQRVHPLPLSSTAIEKLTQTNFAAFQLFTRTHTHTHTPVHARGSVFFLANYRKSDVCLWLRTSTNGTSLMKQAVYLISSHIIIIGPSEEFNISRRLF